MVSTTSIKDFRLKPKGLWHRLRHRVPRRREQRLSIGDGLFPVEILQEIFSYLDTRLLYECRSICRLWKHCLPGDSPVLRALMFLPSPKDHHTRQKPTESPLTFLFGVTIHADFASTEEPQLVTDYTVRSHPHGIGGFRKYGTSFNPFLLFDRTRRQLEDYTRGDSGSEPLWMTALICMPPHTSLTVHLDFLQTTQPATEPSSTFFPARPLTYISTRTIKNQSGITVGDLLRAFYEDVKWPELNLREDSFYKREHVRLLPFPGGDRCVGG